MASLILISMAVPVLIVLAVLVWLFMRIWKNHAVYKCSHCGAVDLVEAGREVVDTKTVEQQGGGYGGGGDIRVQMQEEVTYHCNNCQRRTTATIRKTN